MVEYKTEKAFFHLPGLFEFFRLYSLFLPLFSEHREYFYDWCEIGSIYGAPANCVWGGGRIGGGDCTPREVLRLLREHGVSARLTFSNSLLEKEHLADEKCNALCRLFECGGKTRNGVIVHSDLLVVDAQLQPIADSFWRYSYLHPDLIDKHLRFLAIANTVTGCAMVMNRASRTVSLPFPSDAFMHDASIAVATKQAGGTIVPLHEALVRYRQHGHNTIGAVEYSF
ncbi:MAG: hypothetical protein MJ106_04285, partial [Lentisphaeria bacterium]|nr:hypothetical protein [Lentisphaeria bacterium]